MNSSAPTTSRAVTSALVEQLYDGKWPSEEEARKSYEELVRQRAIQAYMLTLPALNVIGMRDGSEATFGKGFHVLPIWKDRMNARTLVTTPNCDVVYSMNYLDLKQTGPLVVYAPPNVIGMFTDFFQRTLTDVGAAGLTARGAGSTCFCPPTTTTRCPADTLPSALALTTCSFSSAPYWRPVTRDPTRKWRWRRRNEPASTRSTALNGTGRGWSSPTPRRSG